MAVRRAVAAGGVVCRAAESVLPGSLRGVSDMLPLSPALRSSLSGSLQEAGPEGDEASRLARAFVTCDEAAVRAWLGRGGDPSLVLPGGYTPLTFLVCNSDSGRWEAVARLLLEAGASPHVRGPKGTPLLSMLVKSCSTELVRLVLNLGAEVDVRGPDGDTPLLAAVHYRQVETLRLLLERGADPNVTSRDGNAALMWAAGRSNGIGMQRSLACVRALLEHGADPNFKNPRSYTPLMAASVIRERGAVHALLAAGAMPDTTDSRGETALIKAADADAVGVIEELLSGGADVDARSASGNTALMSASSLEAVTLLLQRGARADLAALDGTTALHLQAVAGRPEQVLRLLEYGAELEAGDAQGNTPLQAAVRCRSHAVARLLIEAGAQANVTNHLDVTAVHEAVLPWDYFKTLDIFPALNTPALRSELVHYVAEGADEAERLLSTLLEEGANPEAAGQGGVTPLMLAVASGQERLSRLLLESGAASDDCDAEGRTALAYACRWGHNEQVDLLLAWGCPTNTLDHHHNLPVYYAARHAHMSILLGLMVPLAFYICSRAPS